MEYATFGRRAGAKFLDFMIAMGIHQGLVAVLAQSFPAMTGFEDTDGGILMFYIFYVAYSSACLQMLRSTPGKMLLGLKIVTPEGNAITGNTPLKRSLAEMASLGIFLVGYLVALKDKQGRTWHDRFASTRVVRKDGRRRGKW